MDTPIYGIGYHKLGFPIEKLFIGQLKHEVFWKSLKGKLLGLSEFGRDVYLQNKFIGKIEHLYHSLQKETVEVI